MSDEVTEESQELAKVIGLKVQPAPVRNGLPSAHDLVVRDIMSRGYTAPIDRTNIRNAYHLLIAIYIGLHEGTGPACDEMKKRKAFGLAKYNTLLQPFNGRDHIEDAMDELGDMLVYLRSYIYEQEVVVNDNTTTE